MGQSTVLGLVNRLKIDQDRCMQLIDDGNRLYTEAYAHLSNASETLRELAELQGIAVKQENTSQHDHASLTREVLMPPRVPTGPERIMS
jgi:hypothetical protein